MADPIMDVTKELGIAEHVAIDEPADSAEPFVTITYAKPVRSRISVNVQLDKDRLKKVLAEMAQLSQRG
jgi:hypothetical protein